VAGPCRILTGFPFNPYGTRRLYFKVQKVFIYEITLEAKSQDMSGLQRAQANVFAFYQIFC